MFYLIGTLVVAAFFDKDIAMASIVILALGDSIPYLVGNKFQLFRSPFNEKKYLEGSFAGFLGACIGATFVLWISGINMSFGFIVVQAFFASLFAMIAEAIDIRIRLNKIDDNIIIPIVAACVIWGIRFLVSLV